MAKTVTIRIDDEIYELLKKAAKSERRSISNFIEYATLSYLTSEMYVFDEEIEDINNIKIYKVKKAKPLSLIYNKNIR